MDEAEVRTLPTTVHGRYLVRPGPEDRLLVGFHGYAENAARHLAELVKIPGVEQWTVVAVQALHPFYVTRTGEVVASWMTSQDREHAIADNQAYVRDVIARFPHPDRLVFAGFSQGVAMAYRASVGASASGIIALAGDLPPDVAAATTSLPPVLIGRGTREEWYSEEKLNKDLNFLQTATTVEVCTFDGAHEWTDEFRTAAGRFLARL